MILQMESRHLLTKAHGYSLLIQDLIEERKPSELPDDFGMWCQNVTESLEELRDLIDGMTDRKHRSILKEERANRDREFGEMLWKDAQQGLSELQNYTSLREAVEKTASRLELSLYTPEIKIDDSFWHPGSAVNFFGKDRRALIGAQKSQYDRHYLGYAVTLSWLKDYRNMEWQEQKGITPSLEEAVTVLHLWLIKGQDLQKIRQDYPWMNSNQTEGG